MSSHSELASKPGRLEAIVAVWLFAGALAFHAWGMSVGWQSKNLPGVEYRQAQTALSAYHIKQAADFSLAYPTPVLGKPWSIPMEFPLYQWTVVLTGQATGLGLIKAGRLVSIVCFYLTLPALFLLLGRWQVAWGRRWLVLALVVSCPFYIFYTRAFLIETMALMFAVWFWVGFERAVKTREYHWLAIAMLAGAGAGLVKVTTLMLYLLPAAVWAVGRLWRGRQSGRWKTDLVWMAAATAVPLVASGWWVWKADQIKALNPVADFLGSAHMRDFNLGNNELRFSPEFWAMKWRIIRDEITWLPLLALSLPGLLLGGRHRIGAVLFCGFIFVAALWFFPVLYAYHEYYYVANAVALLLAAGLAVVGLAESVRWRWLGMALAVVLVGGQMYWYREHYLPVQQEITAGGNRLTDTLRQLTTPNDVLVVVGQDWNSMTPYYSRRRALMLRGDAVEDAVKIDRALANLSDETIGALVITGQTWREKSLLLGRLSGIGLSDQPLLRGQDTWLFFRKDREAQVIRDMREGNIAGFAWAPGAEPTPEPLASRWHEVADLPGYQRELFASMNPVPTRFFCTFEPARQVIAQEVSFGAHPLTRLVFQLRRGPHVLRNKVWFNPDAYNSSREGESTDGVEVRLTALLPNAGNRVLASRLVDPGKNAANRGPVPIEFHFELEQDGEVELLLGPGPNDRDTRDWIWIRGPLVIH